MHQKDNPQKPLAKVLKTREEMQTLLENKKNATTDFLKIVLKKNNRVEEGGASSSKMKIKHESTNLKAQK
jgi:hypothetical protein